MDLLAQARAERESGRMFTLRHWLAEHPPPPSAFRQTLAAVSDRCRSGEPFLPAVREFLDEFQLRTGAELRQATIAEQPEPSGDTRFDAYLGALGEHLAAVHDLPRPEWTIEPGRFLDRFWFVSEVPGFRALAIAESPAAFRRRAIFVSRGSLERC